MSEKRPDPSFRGFTRRSAAPDMEDSQALTALRRLREDSAPKASTPGKEPAGSHPVTTTTASVRQEDEREDHAGALLDAEEDEDRYLPSRKELYPSNYAKITRWFYNILFLLFIGLLIALFLWGRHKMAMEG
ncbi:hypothetical protein [Paenibacillus popilliae]|uniref:2-polyprenyl-6-methoxyphenol hydroxylase n=1 Tax=Paenibacillus popilliae ATCC 14706 TaxID=1212764 RepID=M9LGV1_PAEPP|nr:hypothetical protein [Paenibacillus popilliae]GAC41890.1 2-polyprenyl-6-methoxyphenol hydroxylase [Paenibacillus popilliae ATCC 14706]